MGEEYHIMPINDLRPHVESVKCLCNPQKNKDGNIVHNSYDGREYDEIEINNAN